MRGHVLIRLRLYLLFDRLLLILKRAYILKFVKALTLKERCLRKKRNRVRRKKV